LILIAMHVINHLNTIILACRNTFGNSMVWRGPTLKHKNTLLKCLFSVTESVIAGG
jgi:hypothetical protein